MRGPLLLCLLLFSMTALAQAPSAPQFRKLGVDDGLPSTTVNAIVQDRTGFVWVGTKDGLARHDGLEFRTYRYAPGDSRSLPGNAVSAVHVDADNRLWVGVEGHGLYLMDQRQEGFSRRHGDGAGPAIVDDIFAMASTADGALWVGTFGGGLYRADRAGTLRQFLPADGDVHSLPDANVLSLAVDKAGVLWVGTTSGLARWDGHGFVRESAADSLGPHIFSLSPDADGSLWIGGNLGLGQRLASGLMQSPAWRDRLMDPGVITVLRDKDQTLWVATRRGVNRVRNGEVDAMLHGAALIAAMADHEGGLWFASLNEGLARLPAGWRHFSVLKSEPGNAASLGIPRVKAMATGRDGRIWVVGVNSAVDRLDLASGQVEHVLATGSGLPERGLQSVLEDADGQVWIGHGKGLSRLDPASRSLRHWLIEEGPQPALKGPVQRLLQTPDGLLWLASYGGGLQARDRRGDIVHELRPGDGKGLEQPDPGQLLVGPDRTLWLAGGAGVQRWDAARGKLQLVPGSPPGRVFGVAFQAPDTVWLSQLGVLGAYRWNGQSLQELRRVDSNQDLPAVELGGLAADSSGAIWVTSGRGLIRYDPIGNRVRVYGVRDGLPGQEFEALPPLMRPDGVGLVSSRTGLVLFVPALIRAAPTTPRLVIESVRLRRDEDDVALLPSAIELLPGDRDLRVIARLLSFDDAKAHRYRYRLLGFDPDWVETGAQGERVFSTLPAGRHQLEVIAANANGIWSPKQTLTLVVHPPWWRTGWARALAALLLAGVILLVAALYRQRLKARHRAQWRKQQQLQAEQQSLAKSRFLATLGHEIRTPMTGVLGMAELLLSSPLEAKQRGRVESIQRAGQHLLRLVNDALDLARIESGKLTLDERAFDLHGLLDEVAQLLAPLAQAKGLTFSLQRSPATPPVLRGDADRVRQILLNLGNNAIKFTERGEVALRSQPLAPHGVLLEVSDTGPGMSAEQQSRLFQRFEQAEGLRTSQRYGGSGLGLAISQELAAAMAGRIEVSSAPGQGATFRVQLPLPNAELGTEVAITAAPHTSRTGLRVLVVEDEATVAEVVVGLLQALGHSARHAAQGLAALTELQAGGFDLAFLDLDLPGLDGLELARLIRAQGHRLPLVALTARADAEAESLARAAGMHGFLRKPVTSAMLQAAMDQALAS